jgi:hypothetical protein
VSAWKFIYPDTASVEAISLLELTGIFETILSAIIVGGCLRSLASWKQTGDESSPISGVGG